MTERTQDTLRDWSRQKLRAFIRKVEPHAEGGEPMVTCHYDLWLRIINLADPLCVNCGLNGSQHDEAQYGDTACSNFAPEEP